MAATQEKEAQNVRVDTAWRRSNVRSCKGDRAECATTPLLPVLISTEARPAVNIPASEVPIASTPGVAGRVAAQLPHIRLPWTKRRYALEKSGLVYYLQRADDAVKIGCTANYPDRRSNLVRQHGSLRLIAWEPGYSSLERERHRQFEHLRLRPGAEWFRLGADLLTHVRSLLVAD